MDVAASGRAGAHQPIPELRSRGYPEYVIMGTLTGAATFGLMIPPSLALVVHGVTINESITKLFMAGILPGLVLAGMFMAYVALWSFVRRGEVPDIGRQTPLLDKIRNSRFLIPVLLLDAVVIGSMYLGHATATEAAAFGGLGSLAPAAGQGSLNRRTFIDSLSGATRTSAMIALILGGSAALSLSMGFTACPGRWRSGSTDPASHRSRCSWPLRFSTSFSAAFSTGSPPSS